MKFFVSLCGCLSAAFLSCSSAFAWTSETSDDRWRSGWGQGIAEAQVTNGSGNSIYVACHSYPEYPDSLSSVTFTLAGRGAQSGNEVLLAFDGQKPEAYYVDNHGTIEPDSRATEGQFVAIIAGLKGHDSVYVRFNDGRESTFSLKGSSDAIGSCSSAS